MKTSYLVLAIGCLIIGGLLGRWSGGSETIELEQEKKPLYWVAPMDANYRRDGPGKSPMGMDLVPVYAQAESDIAGTVSIEPHVINSLGVKVAPVKRGDFSPILNTVGFLQYDETTLQHYHVRVNGWVERLYIASVGDKIKKGQKLFDIYSPELVYAQEEYVSALLNKNQTLLHAAKLKLIALGVDEAQINQLQNNKQVLHSLPFFAREAGFVSMLNVSEGSYVQPQLEIMATGNFEKIWVMTEVFERQANALAVGQNVVMKLDSFPSREWLGKVDYIYPMLNNLNRTIKARIVIENSDLKLKPNMFAQLSIQGKAITDTLSVPSQAIIQNRAGARVVLALGEGKFRSVKVVTGIENNGQTQILDGLTQNQHVVASAQFLIDSESSINADLSRMETEVQATDDVTRVWVQGKVQSVLQNNRLSLQHEAIPKWQWPAMSMALNVDKKIDLTGIKAGDEIGFCLDKVAKGEYLITHIEQNQLQMQSEQTTESADIHTGMQHD